MLVSVVASALQAKIPASTSAAVPTVTIANLRISTPFLLKVDRICGH